MTTVTTQENQNAFHGQRAFDSCRSAKNTWVTTKDPVLPPTKYGDNYSSRILSVLQSAAVESLSSLNCSYFSQTSGQAPTLHEIKSHARSLACIIRYLDNTEASESEDAFDWLDDLDGPYINSDPSHHIPLKSLTNLTTSHRAHTAQQSTAKPVCPISIDSSDIQAIFAHANAALEALDEICAEDGGLLGCLPPQSHPTRAASDSRVLGQFLSYTTGLTSRISELEIDVARMRDVLASEAMVPRTIESASSLGGIPLTYPQDRYVLADISPALWRSLCAAFDTEDMRLRKLRSAHDALTRPVAKGSGVPDSTFIASLSENSTLERCATIDVTSRLYRLSNSPTIFIIPAYAPLHPETVGTRQLETRPLVATVPSPAAHMRTPAQWRHMTEALRTANEDKALMVVRLNKSEGEINELKTMLRRETERRADVERALKFQAIA